MPIEFVSASSGTTGNANLTITAPASIVSGNFLLAALGEDSGPDTVTTVPAGWTLLAAVTIGGGGGQKSWIYYKFAGASEPGSYEWIFSSGGPDHAGIILQFSGVNASTPFDASPFQNNASSAATVTFAAATPNFINDMYVPLLICAGSIAGGSAVVNSPPTDASYTLGELNAGYSLIVGFYRLLTSANPVQALGLSFKLGSTPENTPPNNAYSLLLMDADPIAPSAPNSETAGSSLLALSLNRLRSRNRRAVAIRGSATPPAGFIPPATPSGDPSFGYVRARSKRLRRIFASFSSLPTAIPTIALSATIADANIPTITGTESATTPPVPSDIAPFVAMLQYNPFNITGYVATLIGLTLDFSGNAQLIDISGATWSGALAAYKNAGPIVGGVQYSDSLLFALGLNIPLQLYKDGAITVVSNTFQGKDDYPPWLPQVHYPQGSKIFAAATPSTGISYIFRAKKGGTSAAGSGPAFPSAFHATVADGSVTWINIGALNTAAPAGAAFVFNHLDFLWVWGTAATYIATDIDGPDSLRMSEQGNPTAFDPANQAFVGHGDGQLPTGGGVWTQLEFGISATPQLVLYKTKSTYSVLGAFPDISISQIPDGVGCAAPNTNQFVPGLGMMRLSYWGVAVFDGTRDEVDQYTDPIRPFLFAEQGANPDIIPVDWGNILRASSAQTVNPPGYLLLVPLQGANGALTRMFFFDRTLKAWSVIDLPPSMQLGCGFFQVTTQQISRTLFGGFSDGIIRQGFSSDEYWDTEGTNPIQWTFRTPASGTPATPIYLRRLLLRLALRGTKAFLTGAVMYDQNRNGIDESSGLPANIDAQGLTQAIDIDATLLGGVEFDVLGSGRALVQGIELQFVPKAPTRIPG